jgi:AcrR family transcriptional regulator
VARLTEEARRRLTQRRRRQILEAAVAVFSEAGYEGATVRAIAERAGLAEGTLYLYFPSKRPLLLGAGGACLPARGDRARGCTRG